MSRFEDKMIATMSEIVLAQQQAKTELMAGLEQTINGRPVRGHRPVTVRTSSTSPSQLLWGDAGRLVGWSLRSTGGTVVVTLTDGRENGEPVGVTVLAPAGEALSVSNHTLSAPGVTFTEALTLTVSGAGTLTGCVLIGAVD